MLFITSKPERVLRDTSIKTISGRFSSFEYGQRFLTITCLGNHLHIRLEIDKHRHAMPQHGMVIHQHHFRFLRLTYAGVPKPSAFPDALPCLLRRAPGIPASLRCCLARYCMILIPIPGSAALSCRHRTKPRPSSHIDRRSISSLQGQRNYYMLRAPVAYRIVDSLLGNPIKIKRNIIILNASLHLSQMKSHVIL